MLRQAGWDDGCLPLCALPVVALSKDKPLIFRSTHMAKVINLGDLCVVVEAKNIGFLKAAKDLVSSELEGIEQLAEESIKDAAEAMPSGYVVTDVQVQVFPNGKDLMVKVIGKKSA